MKGHQKIILKHTLKTSISLYYICCLFKSKQKATLKNTSSLFFLLIKLFFLLSILNDKFEDQ